MNRERENNPFEWLFLKSKKMSFPEALSKPFFTSHWHKLGHITCSFLQQSLTKKRDYEQSVLPVPRPREKFSYLKPMGFRGTRGDINKKEG